MTAADMIIQNTISNGFLMLLLATAATAAASSPAVGCVASPLLPDGCLLQVGAGVEMAWALVAPSSIAIAVRAQTSGYVSFAVTPPGRARMSPADAVFGWMSGSTATVAAYQINGYSASDVKPDSTVTLTNTSIVQSGGWTTVTFTRPLAAGRYVINPTALSYNVAQAPSGGLVQHSKAASGTADLTLGAVTITSVDSRDKFWIIHGLLMLIAWALLVPHAIGFARYKAKWSAIFRRDAMWFHTHRGLQLAALVLHIVSMAVALSEFGNLIEDGALSAHSALAWIVTALLGVQWLVAVFLRPDKKHARRGVWNAFHFTAARVLLLAALANCGLGIYLYQRKTNRLLMPLGAWIGIFVALIVTALIHFVALALRPAPVAKDDVSDPESSQPAAKSQQAVHDSLA